MAKSSLEDVTQNVLLKGPNFTINNSFAFDGGIIVLTSPAAHVKMDSIEVTNSTASDKGGILYVQSGMKIEITRSSFKDSFS